MSVVREQGVNDGPSSSDQLRLLWTRSNYFGTPYNVPNLQLENFFFPHQPLLSYHLQLHNTMSHGFDVQDFIDDIALVDNEELEEEEDVEDEMGTLTLY